MQSIFLRVGKIRLQPDEYRAKLSKNDHLTDDGPTFSEKGVFESALQNFELVHFKRFLVDIAYRTGKTKGEVNLIVDIRARLVSVTTGTGELHPQSAVQAIERVLEPLLQEDEHGILFMPTETPSDRRYVCRTDPMRLVALLHFLQDNKEHESERFLMDEELKF